MPTVGELSAPFENYLRPVLPVASGVCSICHTSVAGGWPRCYQCGRAQSALPVTASALSFVALAVKDEQFARDLYQYKDPRQSEQERRRLRLGLAAVLWRWLSHHEECLSRRVGVSEFSIVSTVPSTRQRASHPLEVIVGRDVALTRDRYQRLLEAVDTQGDDRTADASQFKAVASVPEGAAVLLVDDTFTTGSRVQSAAARLRLSGAGTVGVVCLGRHFNRRQEGAHAEAAEAYLQQVRARGWSWSSCCLCA